MKPAEEEDARWSEAGVEIVLDASKGYPYFLQEFGKASWDVAPDSTITQDDAIQGVRIWEDMPR